MKIKTFFKKIYTWSLVHKKISIAVLLVVLAGGYGIAKAYTGTTAQTKYVLATVEKGSVISSVSGSGQVTADNQIDVKSKVSGDIVSVNVVAGQSVTEGQLLAQVDSTDAALNLQSAQIAYNKQVTNNAESLRDAKTSVTDAQNSVDDSYTNAKITLTKSLTDMTDVINSLQTQFDKGGFLNTTNRSDLSATSLNYFTRAEGSYLDAQDKFNALVKSFGTVSAATNNQDVENVLTQFSDTASSVAQAAKYAQDAVVYMKNNDSNGVSSAATDAAYTTITSLSSKANSVVSSLITSESTITSSKRTLEKAQNNLTDFQSGSGQLDVQSQYLSLQQKQVALSDYYIRAPFDGIIASVTAKKGESAGTVATLITKKKIAEISLNEVDAAKIKVGQKVTLTFDAVDGLTISGEVAEVDLVGTVTQGVVNYTVKIGFDTDDARIKPGMTVNANIITDMKQDVIQVPSSAIKTQGGTSYVQVVDGNADVASSQNGGITLSTAPRNVEVTIGLTSDDNVEIISGLNEGQTYISRTITSSTNTASTKTTTPSLFGGGNNRGGAGGLR